jgi:inhibitor of KinA sporulation pathway (predicted exonuclease)
LYVVYEKHLVHDGVNKGTIQNSWKPYKINILSFYFLLFNECLVVLGVGASFKASHGVAPLSQVPVMFKAVNKMSQNKDRSFYYLVVDLEATCSEDGAVPRSFMEIIEIGAVMVNHSTWQIDSEFQQFVKPVRNPYLTEFCTQLTSIKQEDVEKAPTFPEAMINFQNWLNKFPNHVFCSWGEYDRKQFIQDCEFHKVLYPFSSEHININKLFSEYLGVSKGYGMAGALLKLGMTLKGTHHRGIDDARNIASIFKYIKTINK